MNPSPSRPPEVRHLQRAHRQSQTPHRSKHRANQLGVVVIRAMAKRLGYLVKYQATARDDVVKSDEGQQGIGLEVHRLPLFYLLPWWLAAVVLRALDHVPGTAQREHAQVISRPPTERLANFGGVILGNAHAHLATGMESTRPVQLGSQSESAKCDALYSIQLDGARRP